MRPSALLVAAGLLLLRSASAQAQAFTQGFDDIATLPGAGWVQINHSAPIGTLSWFQGNGADFPAHMGAPDAYIAVNFESTGANGTISNWLLTPPAMLVNGATLSFYTRTIDFPIFADRLQVRLSTAGASVDVGTTATDVGDFTTLLLDIDPNYVPTDYPSAWAHFTGTVTGLASPTLGRFGFRYFVEDGGAMGLNSDYIGIDTVEFSPGTGATVVPIALSVDAGGNQVLEVNEAAVALRPTWRNTSTVAIASMTGALGAFTGPVGSTYTIDDPSAAYGSIAPATNATCTDCYAVTITSTARPATHWDASAVEQVSAGPTTKTWTLHVGNSFTDVPASNGFYRFVETLLHKGVTSGCGATTYCASASTTRAQLAVFVLVAREGPGYSPVPCGATPMFPDVPPSSPFCRFVEELARRGVVGGCGGGSYCANSPATREQMAVFVLRTLDPALNPPACGTPVFTDVPASSPFCRWIEELVRRGVVTGCGAGTYCPADPVTREQMGVFITVTFGLVLYGP